MVNLICGIHNHALIKSFAGYSYVGRLTKDEKIYCWSYDKVNDQIKEYSLDFE